MAAPFGERLRRASLGPRTLTAVLGIPLVVLALWAGGVWWGALTVVVALLGWIEFARLHALSPVLRVYALTVLIGSYAILIWGDDVVSGLFFGAWALVMVGAGFLQYFRRGLRSPQALRSNAAVLGGVYLSVPTALLARWRLELPMPSVLAFLLVIWANDIASYFVGIAAGRHKLAPHISPGKSWEGAAGGLAAGGAVGALAAPLFGVNLVQGLLVGLAATIASQVGDLFESAMKRRAGLKDSGAILPGHGGILDRFDGMLVAAPIAYMMVRLAAAPR